MLVDEVLEQEDQAELEQEDQRHQQRNADTLPQRRPLPLLDPGGERGKFGRQIRRGEDFVLLVHENPALVQDLVNHVLGAGVWLDERQENRNKAVAIAAGRSYFNQDPNIIRFVMENPTDRVTYGDLRMIRAEFEELMQLSLEAGTIKHPIPYETYVDETFAKNATPTKIDI